MKGFSEGYRTTAVIILNIVVVLVFSELIASLVIGPYHWVKYDRMISRSWPSLQRAFPGYSKDDVKALMRENMQVAHFIYAPWLQFRVPSLTGRFINTDGFRRSNGINDDWRSAMPDREHLDVYFLGGSTMFGFGVADKDTIPAAFQRLAPKSWNVRAYNYGQPYYYSRQETLLFEQLLRSGKRPDVAVFMDGLNESLQRSASYLKEPFFTPLLQRRMASPIDWQTVILNLNVSRALNQIGLSRDPSEKDVQYYSPPPGISSSRVVSTIVDQYLENLTFTQKLCNIYAVRCLFIWQPVPMVHYRNSLDTLSDQTPSAFISSAYTKIADLNPKPENLLDLQDALSGFEGQPFVDAFHYSPSFQQYLAKRIVTRLGDTPFAGR